MKETAAFLVWGWLALATAPFAALASEKAIGHGAVAAADLCNELADVKYTARWAAGQVTLTAKGTHRTGGYQVALRQGGAELFPPQFTLVHKRPEGIVTQAITPFNVTATYRAAEKPKAVTVKDAQGSRDVEVK